MISTLTMVEPFAERVLNSIPEGLLIALFTWLLLRIIGRQSSGTRFAAWFVALLAMAALPIIPDLSPAGSVARAVHAEVTLPATWVAPIVALWMLISALAAARLISGLYRLRSLRATAEPVNIAELAPVVQQTLQDSRGIRPVEICTSSEVRVPAAIGFFHPAILLPEWALRDLSAEELQAVLLHELAHLQRWDDWTNLAQKIVGGLFFFHPAVWWVERRLSLEREMACDDQVLARTNDSRAYARCLVSLAEKSLVRRGLAMAQAVIGRTRETSLRLARILDLNRPAATRIFRPAIATVVGFAGLCIFALPNAPRWIAFQDAGPGIAAAVAAPPVIGAPPQAPEAISKVVPARTIASHAYAQSAKIKPPVRSPQVIVAKQQPASVKDATSSAVTQEYVVFTQTVDYTDDGPPVVRFAVWKLTLKSNSEVPKVPNQT